MDVAKVRLGLNIRYYIKTRLFSIEPFVCIRISIASTNFE